MNKLPHACPERADKRFKRLDSRLVTILMLSHSGGKKKGGDQDSVLRSEL